LLVLLARRVFALLIGVLLVGLPTLAFADPPDPTWIAGYWDDDDFDDAVIAITAASAVEAPPPVDTELPLWVPIALVEIPRHEAYGAPHRPAASPRAPPVDSPIYH
jgi:hypothetical protein